MDMSNIFVYFLTLIFGSMIMIGALSLGIVFLDKIIFQVDFWKELKEKNIAVAIFLGSLVIAIAIVLSSAG
jgi:uncharacterized membrane protein YjfL (UPF0719 family)